MTYDSEVYVPLYAKFDVEGKLTAICCVNPTPGSMQRVDITLALMQLFDERSAGDVPVTTQVETGEL
jgi:hypothetical protein